MKADKSPALSRRIARFCRFRNGVGLYFGSGAMHFFRAGPRLFRSRRILSDVTEI
jgi:hypothetical protein